MSAFSWETFRAVPVIAILRSIPLHRLPPLIEAIRAGGLTTVEITLNSPDALEQIRWVRDLGTGLNLGAGTVLSASALDAAVEAGATFIVTPALQPAVLAHGRRRGIPMFPGALSPTEVQCAWEQGASMVKVFPADRLGPGYLRRLRERLPEVPLVPTGGVDLDTLDLYRAAGAQGYGVGSPLFGGRAVETADWDTVRRRCAAFRDKVQQGLETTTGNERHENPDQRLPRL